MHRESLGACLHKIQSSLGVTSYTESILRSGWYGRHRSAPSLTPTTWPHVWGSTTPSCSRGPTAHARMSLSWTCGQSRTRPRSRQRTWPSGSLTTASTHLPCRGRCLERSWWSLPSPRARCAPACFHKKGLYYLNARRPF
jgi:hypothetical protein